MAVKKYEAVMVFTVAKGEEATQALVEKFKALIAENGTVESVDVWGKRKLAYPIDFKTEGYYVLVNFNAPANLPSELERVMRITDGVVRFMVVKK